MDVVNDLRFLRSHCPAGLVYKHTLVDTVAQTLKTVYECAECSRLTEGVYCLDTLHILKNPVVCHRGKQALGF